MGHLFVIERQAGGGNVGGTNASSLANPEEVDKGEKCKAGYVGTSEGAHVFCQGDEEFWCGPELGRGRGSQALEGLGKGPMEGGNGDG